MLEEIFRLALSLCPGISSQEEEMLRLMCNAAAQELKSRLRCGVSPEDCAESFCLAAALLAVSNLQTSGGIGEIASFTVGHVTIRRAEGTESTERTGGLRQQALEILAPYMTGNFAFLGVRG